MRKFTVTASIGDTVIGPIEFEWRGPEDADNQLLRDFIKYQMSTRFAKQMNLDIEEKTDA